MDFGSINWLAVVACVVVSMISGSIWYNPKTFFPAWWKGIGKKGEPGMEGNMGMTWGLTILASAVQAIFMGYFVPALGGSDLASGAMIGFWLWLGIVAPTYLVNKLFAGHSFTVYGIEVGNHLVNFLIFGAIFGIWH